MSIQRRRIPPLPERPRVHPIGRDIVRSYTVGRESVSRACLGETLVLTIASQEALPEGVRASLVTTLGSKRSEVWAKIPFTRLDDRTLTSRVLAAHPGLRSFRAEFSVDGGRTWLRDTVPDAWVLVEPSQVDGLRIYSLIPTVSGTLSGKWDSMPSISCR